MSDAERASYYQDQLRETGYLSLSSGFEPQDIEPIFGQFRDLYDLVYADDGSGKELFDALAYVVPERSEDGDYFIVRRRVGELNQFSKNRSVGTDDKDVAHIGPRSLAVAQERLGKRMPAVMRQFIESCVEVHEATKTNVRPIFRALGMEEAMLAKNPADDIHMVRVLRYLGTAASHKADLHFDRSAATFAVWESSPGLVGAPGNNAYLESSSVDRVTAMAARADESPINHVAGQGKLFLGAGYNHLPTAIHKHNGYLPLLAHGVVNETPDQERDAIIVFMNPRLGYKGYSVPAKHETGFNDLHEHLATESKAA